MIEDRREELESLRWWKSFNFYGYFFLSIFFFIWALIDQNIILAIIGATSLIYSELKNITINWIDYVLLGEKK